MEVGRFAMRVNYVNDMANRRNGGQHHLDGANNARAIGTGELAGFLL